MRTRSRWLAAAAQAATLSSSSLMPFDVNRCTAAASRRRNISCRSSRSCAPVRNPQRRRRAQQIRIESGSGADASTSCAAVAQMQRYGIVRMAGNDIDARINIAARERERDVVAGRYAELLRGGRADHCRVVPGESRDGLGQLLQPAIVRVFAVADRRIGAKDNFESVCIAAGQPFG